MRSIALIWFITILFFIIGLSAGCSTTNKHFYKTNPVKPHPFEEAVSFCNNVNKTQITYVLTKEKVNSLGKVLTTNPAPPKIASSGCSGWWTNFNSKFVEIREISRIDIYKAVAVKIKGNYVKAIAQNN